MHCSRHKMPRIVKKGAALPGALAACGGSGSDRTSQPGPARPGPPQQNALRQRQPKSVSAPARCPSPQKARVLIGAFTRGLLAGGCG